MGQFNVPAELNDSLLEEASNWFIDFNEGELDEAGRKRFYGWLRRSPEHVRAYIEIAAVWQDSERLSTTRKSQLDAVIAQALAEHNVVDLVPRSGSATSAERAESPRRSTAFAIAASMLMLIGGSFAAWHFGPRDSYSTGTAEQRSIRLDDGSIVELNSRSRIRVRYSERERDVDLLEGQALFRVSKDASRPFIVSSGGTRVRAVGTEFDVYRKATGTIVTVIEGRVSVTDRRSGKGEGTSALIAAGNDRNKAPEPVFLIAGEQLTVGPPLTPQPVRVDAAAVTAWTERKLIFNETPLAEVVAEFNRYNARQIVVEDPALADFHIRGNFQTTDPERLIRFLHDRFDVQVTEEDDEVRLASGEQK